MNITKNDVGRKVITNSGQIGTIIEFDVKDIGKLPVRVEFSRIRLWYPITGQGAPALLTDEDTITFYEENSIE